MKIVHTAKAKLALKTLICLIFGLLGGVVHAVDIDTDHCFNDNDPLDPLMVDLGQNGFQLGEPGAGVWFDLFANGEPVKMQWSRQGGDEAFVIFDQNGNGLADNGAEMFTNYNPLVLENRVAPNGFIDLAQYDQPQLGGNNDGYISNDDAIWPQLMLWLDNNADGIATADEMLLPESAGLTHFYTIPKHNGRRDNAGNKLPLWAWAKNAGHQGNNQYKMIDVLFKPVE